MSSEIMFCKIVYYFLDFCANEMETKFTENRTKIHGAGLKDLLSTFKKFWDLRTCLTRMTFKSALVLCA